MYICILYLQYMNYIKNNNKMCKVAFNSMRLIQQSIQMKFLTPTFFCIKSAVIMFTTWYLYFYCIFRTMCHWYANCNTNSPPERSQWTTMKHDSPSAIIHVTHTKYEEYETFRCSGWLTHICISKLAIIGPQKWLVAWSVPSHYLN